jgi:hypothetical protein
MIDTLPADEVERLFVETFFVKDRQDRALYLLASKKKRRDFFGPLRGEDPRLKAECVHDLPTYEPNKALGVILTAVRARGAERVGYLMSHFSEIDRQFVPLEDGLSICLNSPMGVVLVCSSKVAFIQGERMAASPPRSILSCAGNPH